MMSEIQKFYKNQTIFLTGGTGFLGKVLVAKLLIACFDLRRVYLLIRPKKNKSAEERFKEFLEDSCFDVLKSSTPNFSTKLRLVEGDCDQPFLGLSPEIRYILQREVTILIHGAADVRFDEKLAISVRRNVVAVKEILNLAKQLEKLQAFLYVSTAFSNAPNVNIEEIFYAPNIAPDDLISLTKILDHDALEAITSRLIENRPNVYTFCKQVAEDVVRREGKSLPVAIIRPAIITACEEYPLPGWMQGLQAFSALCYGGLLGILRSIYCKRETRLFLIPCDHVANHILTVGWDLGQLRSHDNIPIYNIVGFELTFALIEEMFYEYRWTCPTKVMIWYPNCSFTESYFWHTANNFFLTTLAYIVHGILLCFGNNLNIVDKWSKIMRGMKMTYFFSTTQFYFHTKNVDTLWSKMKDDDKNIFNFNVIDAKSFCDKQIVNVRTYVTKESPDDIPQNIKRVWIFFFLHYAVKFSFIVSVAYFFFKIINWL